jgi:hypothetical protein
MRSIVSAITTWAFLCGSLVACAPPRQPVSLDIDLGPTPGRRCVVIYELQQRAPLGMATYWAVHREEAANAGRLQVSKTLCPNLMITALGGSGELVEHYGRRKVVVLNGPDADTPCNAPELQQWIASVEAQLNDSEPVRCAG